MKFVKNKGILHMVALQFIVLVFEKFTNYKISSVKHFQRVINTSKQFAKTRIWGIPISRNGPFSFFTPYFTERNGPNFFETSILI